MPCFWIAIAIEKINVWVPGRNWNVTVTLQKQLWSRQQEKKHIKQN